MMPRHYTYEIGVEEKTRPVFSLVRADWAGRAGRGELRLVKCRRSPGDVDGAMEGLRWSCEITPHTNTALGQQNIGFLIYSRHIIP